MPQWIPVEHDPFSDDAPLSQNIEDRRTEPPYFDPVMQRINRAQQPPVQVVYPDAMANLLGFNDIGRSPQQSPTFYGPSAPSGNFANALIEMARRMNLLNR
jgi:hypothetical protein